MCIYIYCITLFYIIVYLYNKNGDALCFLIHISHGRHRNVFLLGLPQRLLPTSSPRLRCGPFCFTFSWLSAVSAAWHGLFQMSIDVLLGQFGRKLPGSDSFHICLPSCSFFHILSMISC